MKSDILLSELLLKHNKAINQQQTSKTQAYEAKLLETLLNLNFKFSLSLIDKGRLLTLYSPETSNKKLIT